MWKWLLVLSAGIAASQPASAKWYEASSDHFVVYADQNEKDVREYTERLERFHAAMSEQLRIENAKPSPSNRVTVYLVRNADAVRKLYGGKNPYIGGFYQSRAGGSIAFVPEVDDVTARASGAEIALLHEYAHHFMYSNSASSYPLWMTEGFAEFYASAKFEKNGDVGLGLTAQHRAYEILQLKHVPIELMLDTEAYLAQKKSKEYDSFYGQSWALYHYLKFDESRKGQLLKYLAAITTGDSEINAAKNAFGDLKKLDKDLNKYIRQSLYYFVLKADKLKTGPIALRPLRAGEAAMMPVRMQSKRGVDDASAAKLLPDARKIAAQFADDPAVLAALSEAEFDAGNDAEAIAAADKAVGIDPAQINATIQKGYAMARQAADAKDEKTAWKNVRKQFVQVNKIEVDHPIPLIQFYQSYKAAGEQPTKNAVDGLEWALSLSPFDSGLRWTVAMQEMEDKKFAEAIVTLGPLANSPHGEESREAAQKLLAEAKVKLAEQQKSSPAQTAK
jgi:cytochrome c-type biogenesis protein CcmH/NrfG